MNQKSNELGIEHEVTTFRSEDKAARDKIRADTAAFIARGGSVSKIKRGQGADNKAGRERLF